MKKTIKGIYRADAFSIDKCGIYNKKLINLEQKNSKLKKELSKKLSKEERELFEDYDNVQFEIANQYNEEYFAKGFELGLKIATEVFYK